MGSKGFRSPGYTALADAIFVPITEPMETYKIKNVRFTLWIDGEEVQVMVGAQFSNDGIYWEDPPGVIADRIEDNEGWQPVGWIEPGTPSRAPEENRAVQTNWVASPAGFRRLNGTLLSEDLNYVRYGIFVLDTANTSYTKGGRVSLSVQAQRIDASTQTSDMVLCFSGGGDGTTPVSVSTPVTGAIPTQDLAKARFTLELSASDAVTVGLRWRGSLDGIVWDETLETIGDSPTASADGIVFPTEFVELTAPDWRFIQVLAHVVNTSSADQKIRSALVRLRTDTRDS